MTFLNKLKYYCKEALYKTLGFLIAHVGQSIVRIILFTCKWEIEGLERFILTAASNKTVLILWHNRLALAPAIIAKFAPQFIYAALISKSRDGELLNAVVQSYKFGRSIRVSHQNRQQAFRDIAYHLETLHDVVVITPDGPRGPAYQVKPGIAWTALETGAYIVPLDWTSTKFWEFNTWDKLRLPKPGATIKVKFGQPLIFEKEQGQTLAEVMEIINRNL